MEQKNFLEAMADWTDVDFAEFELGAALGLFERTQDSFVKNKHIFWTDNDLGNALYDMLCSLICCGMLERQDNNGIQLRRKR